MAVRGKCESGAVPPSVSVWAVRNSRKINDWANVPWKKASSGSGEGQIVGVSQWRYVEFGTVQTAARGNVWPSMWQANVGD